MESNMREPQSKVGVKRTEISSTPVLPLDKKHKQDNIDAKSKRISFEECADVKESTMESKAKMQTTLFESVEEAVRNTSVHTVL